MNQDSLVVATPVTTSKTWASEICVVEILREKKFMCVARFCCGYKMAGKELSNDTLVQRKTKDSRKGKS